MAVDATTSIVLSSAELRFVDLDDRSWATNRRFLLDQVVVVVHYHLATEAVPAILHLSFKVGGDTSVPIGNCLMRHRQLVFAEQMRIGSSLQDSLLVAFSAAEAIHDAEQLGWFQVNTAEPCIFCTWELLVALLASTHFAHE